MFIGTGGAVSLMLGIGEMLKRSDILAPDMSVHAGSYFSVFGIPVFIYVWRIVYAIQ